MPIITRDKPAVPTSAAKTVAAQASAAATAAPTAVVKTPATQTPTPATKIDAVQSPAGRAATTQAPTPANRTAAAIPTPAPERVKALGVAMDSIKKQYGEGSIMRLGDSRHGQIDVVPTGAISLDVALGLGGLPRGRVVEIYGPESSGKTTLAQHVAAEVQKRGGIAAIVDAEHAMDPDYARALGVNVDELLISQPDTGEQALEITEQLVRSGAVDLVIIDSVAALVPKAEIEGEMGDSLPGLQARLMSQALRKLTAIVNKTHTMVIFINQLRQKIGVMYGNPETTTGGNALKFYASVRLDIRKIETLKKDGQEYGNRVKVKVVKNKVAPPFRVAEFDIIYGRGINSTGCILDMAAEMDIVKKSGTWFSYKDERIGQGRDAARTFLESNPSMLKEIETQVKAEIATRQP